MDAEDKTTLIAAAEALKSGMFVHIHGYTNRYGEQSHVTVHADASYDSVHARSLTKLNELAATPDLTVEIVRNFYLDEAGKQYTRTAKGRSFVAGTKETVACQDPDFQEAIAKLRESITNPKAIANNYDKAAPGTFDNTKTGKTYFRNVLVSSKQIIVAGKYPDTCSARVNLIRDALQKMLPIGKYRTYTLDESKFDYISLMHEQVSSSSSSSAP